MDHVREQSLGFKSFRCARAVIVGIETMHLLEPALLLRQNLQALQVDVT